MVQEQQRPQRPGEDPGTRELDPMQRPEDMPQLDDERQLEQEQGEPTPQEWTEPASDIGGDAAPPVGAEVERTPVGMDAPRQGVGITGAAIPEDAEARGGAGV